MSENESCLIRRVVLGSKAAFSDLERLRGDADFGTASAGRVAIVLALRVRREAFPPRITFDADVKATDAELAPAAAADRPWPADEPMPPVGAEAVNELSRLTTGTSGAADAEVIAGFM